ncbi:FAD-binding oxidoreductase [Longispora albida]|uniref:FAD-binding oxidoreductase n=1 Tax=Longispora albida TaxID=203523 RepID=UPI0003707DBB|nr:FAD-binding oxidoreductase [Longispora albida]
MRWGGWGDPDRTATLPESVTALLGSALGVERPGQPIPDAASAKLPPSRITELPGADSSAGARLAHLRGKSTPDLLKIRAGDVSAVPDAVARPESHEEVVALLAECGQRGIAVVPFGGGTSVVGGLTPETGKPVLALDLARMDQLIAFDSESRTATFGPGARAPQAEKLLNQRGYTLGHFPQSFEYATIGGFAATRSSGQASAGYGRFDELVVALRAATPTGTIETGRAPRSAAGPDLRQLLLGSEGAFGVITSVTVAIRPVPEVKHYEGWTFEDFAAGTAAMRSLAQDGPQATVLRLSDEFETAIGLSRPGKLGHGAGGCQLILGFEGTAAEVEAKRAAAGDRLRALGGEPLGTEPGEAWAHGRFSAPYLRDALLDAGALVETLETATFWSTIPDLYEAVREAIVDTLVEGGTPPMVLCHVSHTYPAGASLYFTVVCALGENPIEQWDAAKKAASEAIASAGGTITHHHGVGRDHLPWYAAEIGPVGVAALRAVKQAVDPDGILNPGVLIP